MTKRIIIRPKASQDLDDHVAYIAEKNVDAALQFFDAARLTIAQLARMPGLGSRYPVNNPRLQGIRKWAVKNFRRYLIFYFEKDDAVEVVPLQRCPRLPRPVERRPSQAERLAGVRRGVPGRCRLAGRVGGRWLR